MGEARMLDRTIEDGDLQRDVGKWATETFGPDRAAETVKHLQEEVEELKAYRRPTRAEAWDAAYEAADCLLLLFSYAHYMGFDLLQVARDKLEINKKRLWRRSEKGYFKHIQAEREGLQT